MPKDQHPMRDNSLSSGETRGLGNLTGQMADRNAQEIQQQKNDLLLEKAETATGAELLIAGVKSAADQAGKKAAETMRHREVEKSLETGEQLQAAAVIASAAARTEQNLTQQQQQQQQQQQMMAAARQRQEAQEAREASEREKKLSAASALSSAANVASYGPLDAGMFTLMGPFWLLIKPKKKS